MADEFYCGSGLSNMTDDKQQSAHDDTQHLTSDGDANLHIQFNISSARSLQGTEQCNTDGLAMNEDSHKSTKAYDQIDKTDEIYCICRRPYDGKSFMIECDLCKEWFHGR